MEAEKAAAAGATDPNAAADPNTAAQPLDYKALLLALLSLPPEATDEEITAKETEIKGTLGTVSDLQTKASTAEQLQQQLDEINKKYQELNDQQQEIFRQKQEADADEILKVYEGYFTDDASKAAIRNILLSDKEAGIAILNGLKKQEPPTPENADETKGAPPAPKHDPANAEMTSEQKLAAQNELIAKIRKEGKFKDYSSAREEARRQKPELFS